MAHDPQGFLKYGREDLPKRPAEERVRDWQPIYLRARDEVVGEQAARCMDCGVAFCHSGCPLGNLIPEWNEFVARDDYVGASERLHATNNFPEFTGWICPAPCEAACVLALNTDPVTIKQVELSIVQRAFDESIVLPQPPRRAHRQAGRGDRLGPGRTGRRAAAHPRRARGDRLRARRPARRPAALRHPGFQDAQGHHRPPAGADARRGHRVRRRTPRIGPADADRLRADFDAVVLAVGALAPRELDHPGRELRGVHQAMEYLPQGNHVQAGDIAAPGIDAAGKDVIIIGGGDTAADCLGTANRQGARSVTVLDHNPRPRPARRAGQPGVAVGAQHPRQLAGPRRGRARGVGPRGRRVRRRRVGPAARRGRRAGRDRAGRHPPGVPAGRRTRAPNCPPSWC